MNWKILIICGLTLIQAVSNITLAQFSGANEDPFLSSQYDRLVGATIEEILPPPENPGEEYERYKAKIEKKLRGEANEELLVSLMALGVTYTPATSNELANIISEGNTYLNGEMGAGQASGIMQEGLDALYNEIRELNLDEASIQLEVLRNYRKSIVYIRQAIQAKYERYQNNYAMNSNQTNQVISTEAGYFRNCQNGSGPSQGVNNFLSRLASVENNNTSQINSLTTTIEADLNALSLPLSTTYAELDTMIADPATPPGDVPKLEKIKSDKQNKDELIAENSWINSCEAEFTPFPGLLSVIKNEEDNYMVGVFDSINDVSGEISLPTLQTSYQSFDISRVCLSPPPSFGLTAYLNRMKSDCGTWINYYSSPYTIPPVNNNPTAAKADQRYQTLSNCTARGRTCNEDEFNRLAGELKAVSVFPIGRKFVVDMMISAIDYARMFYADLLSNPMFTDCEDSQQTDLQKFYCYSAQRTSTECLTGLGIDCERAEVGYLFYKFKLDTEGETAQFATNQQGESGQEFDQAEGFANLGNIEAPPSTTSVGANGFGNPNTPGANGSTSSTGSSLTDNTKSKQAKIQGAKGINSSSFTAPDPKSLAYRGQKRKIGGSKGLRKYIKETYLKKSKLKIIKSNKNKAGFASKVMGDLSKLALGKLAGSYTAKENLFLTPRSYQGRSKCNIVSI